DRRVVHRAVAGRADPVAALAAWALAASCAQRPIGRVLLFSGHGRVPSPSLVVLSRAWRCPPSCTQWASPAATSRASWAGCVVSGLPRALTHWSPAAAWQWGQCTRIASTRTRRWGSSPRARVYAAEGAPEPRARVYAAEGAPEPFAGVRALEMPHPSANRLISRFSAARYSAGRSASSGGGGGTACRAIRASRAALTRLRTSAGMIHSRLSR